MPWLPWSMTQSLSCRSMVMPSGVSRSFAWSSALGNGTALPSTHSRSFVPSGRLSGWMVKNSRPVEDTATLPMGSGLCAATSSALSGSSGMPVTSGYGSPPP